jgi:hypothetical protein
MSPITPTVGRVVLYRSFTSSEGSPKAELVPAVITRVRSDTCVNLQVLADAHETFWATSVSYFDDEQDHSGQGWTWPPGLKAIATTARSVHAAPPPPGSPAEQAWRNATPPLPAYTFRELTDHKVNPANDVLKVSVFDEPGAGGAHHHYLVTLPGWERAPDGSGSKGVWDIQFQKGAIAEAGVNGLTHEALLAIVIDRLRSFQAGPYVCRENGHALEKLEEAMHWLHHRTRARMARGVEGTLAK